MSQPVERKVLVVKFAEGRLDEKAKAEVLALLDGHFDVKVYDENGRYYYDLEEMRALGVAIRGIVLVFWQYGQHVEYTKVERLLGVLPHKPPVIFWRKHEKSEFRMVVPEEGGATTVEESQAISTLKQILSL